MSLEQALELAPGAPTRGQAVTFVPAALVSTRGAAPTRAERDGARAVGYAEGWALGAREATAQRAAEAAEHARTAQRQQRAVDAALSAVRVAADELSARAVARVDELTELVVAGALELASAIIAREVASCDDPGLDALRRALAPLPSRGLVLCRLNPADLAAIDVDAVAAGVHEVRLVADPSLQRGDAVAVQDDATVDARLGQALARARAVLQP